MRVELHDFQSPLIQTHPLAFLILALISSTYWSRDCIWKTLLVDYPLATGPLS